MVPVSELALLLSGSQKSFRFMPVRLKSYVPTGRVGEIKSETDPESVPLSELAGAPARKSAKPSRLTSPMPDNAPRASMTLYSKISNVT